MSRVLLLDNYDSFTYNLEHIIIGLGAEVVVQRNDVELTDIDGFTHYIISPGPGLPEDAGVTMELLKRVAGEKPILGVCLGMQAIAVYLGGELFNQEIVKHGVQESIKVAPSVLFLDMEERQDVGLYHSWAVAINSGVFTEVAYSDTGVLMGLENLEQNMFGVQFHPESIMTPNGKQIIRNFLNFGV